MIKRMRIKELVEATLKELDRVNQVEEKKKYLVDEVTLEISVSSIEKERGGLSFKILNVGADGNIENENEKAHKIIIKLKPK